jgi:hypothetical protein
LTREGLAERSGVPLATLRKFEQKGSTSLESFFLKLLMVIGGLEEFSFITFMFTRREQQNLVNINLKPLIMVLKSKGKITGDK